jgi:hypothetical protein
MEEYVTLFNFVRGRGQGQQRQGVEKTSSRDEGDEGDEESGEVKTVKKDSARVREEKAKIERMTQRMVAQVVGRAAGERNVVREAVEGEADEEEESGRLEER